MAKNKACWPMLCQNKEATEKKIEPTLMYNVSILIERVILNWLITWKPQWPNVKIFDCCDFTPTLENILLKWIYWIPYSTSSFSTWKTKDWCRYLLLLKGNICLFTTRLEKKIIRVKIIHFKVLCRFVWFINYQRMFYEWQ